MQNQFTLFVLLSISILFNRTFAQLTGSNPQPPNIRPITFKPSGGRVGIVNRTPAESDWQAIFWIEGLQYATKYLEFDSRVEKDGGSTFKLINWHGMSPVAPTVPMKWGRGDFTAQWGASTAKCHLEAKVGEALYERESKKFSFLPGGTQGSYLWPYGFQDWVQVVCEGPVSSCLPGGW